MAKQSKPLDPLVLQPDAGVPAKAGPQIILIGEGADKVPFTINPLAVRYEVHGATGMVLEYLQ